MKIEFSKIMVIGIFVIWVGSLTVSIIKPSVNFILDYTNNVMLSGCVGYIIKSGAENVPKVLKTFGKE